MSLTYDHGDIVFQCDGDGCHETLETNTSNFDSARNVMHRNHWQPKRPSGHEWLHYCPDCQSELFSKRRKSA